MRIAGNWSKSVSLTRRAKIAALAVAIISVVVLSGCTEVANPTATAVVFEPTPAPAGSRELVLAGASAADIAALAKPIELPEGNAASGEELHTSLGCAACHSVGEDVVVGPGWKGLYSRAGERTEMEADDYLVKSITKPSSYIVEGFTNVMPAFDYLSDQELADLIAFVKANE